MATVWKMSAVGAVALLFAGCATPSARIATELTRFGLDQNQAACVGDRLEARLSLAQLKQLARAAHAYSSNDPNPRQLTAGDLARVSAQINDPKMPIEVATAAASCGVLRSLLSL
jgi:hypothetical protein